MSLEFIRGSRARSPVKDRRSPIPSEWSTTIAGSEPQQGGVTGSGSDEKKGGLRVAQLKAEDREKSVSFDESLNSIQTRSRSSSSSSSYTSTSSYSSEDQEFRQQDSDTFYENGSVVERAKKSASPTPVQVFTPPPPLDEFEELEERAKNEGVKEDVDITDFYDDEGNLWTRTTTTITTTVCEGDEIVETVSTTVRETMVEGRQPFTADGASLVSTAELFTSKESTPERSQSSDTQFDRTYVVKVHTGDSPVVAEQDKPVSRVSSTTTTRTLDKEEVEREREEREFLAMERQMELEAKLAVPNKPYDEELAAKTFTPPEGDEMKYQMHGQEPLVPHELDVDTELGMPHGEVRVYQRKENPYSDILEFEDELPKNRPPPKASRAPSAIGSLKPLAAGVKGKIKVPEEEPRPEVHSPVYATVKKEWKRPDSRSSQVSQNPKYTSTTYVTKASELDCIANHIKPVDDRRSTHEVPRMVLLEDEGHNINVQEQQKKQRKLSFGFTLKKKKKRQSMKDMISSPVGEVVHTDGHASPDILKTLGVGREQEGAKLTTLPRADSRNGVADIVSYEKEKKKNDSEDEYSDPTLHHSMFVDAKTKRHKSEKEWVNVPVNVDVVEYKPEKEKEEESFSDPTLHPNLLLRGEAVPAPVEDIDLNLAPPETFADHDIESHSTKDLVFSLDTFDDIHMKPQTPIKREKKGKKPLKRQISKDVISYPVVSSVVHEDGRSSPKLMDAYGVHVVKRSHPEQPKLTSPTTVKSKTKVGRAESLLVTSPSLEKKTYSRQEIPKRQPSPQFEDPFAPNFVIVDTPEPEKEVKEPKLKKPANNKRNPRDRLNSEPVKARNVEYDTFDIIPKKTRKTVAEKQNDPRGGRSRRNSEPGKKKKETEPSKSPTRNQSYLSFMYSDIPGLENVNSDVIQKYVASMLSMTSEPIITKEKLFKKKELSKEDYPEDMFKPDVIEAYILHMQSLQIKRGVLPDELDYFDPEVIQKYMKMTKGAVKEDTKLAQSRAATLPAKKTTPQAKSKEIFNSRRASLEQFLAKPENNRREGQFTYLSMAKDMVPWFKEHGQQDDKLTNAEILDGHRFSEKGEKDPRFPDYEKRRNVNQNFNSKNIKDLLEKRLSGGRGNATLPPRPKPAELKTEPNNKKLVESSNIESDKLRRRRRKTSGALDHKNESRSRKLSQPDRKVDNNKTPTNHKIPTIDNDTKPTNKNTQERRRRISTDSFTTTNDHSINRKTEQSTKYRDSKDNKTTKDKSKKDRRDRAEIRREHKRDNRRATDRRPSKTEGSLRDQRERVGRHEESDTSSSCDSSDKRALQHRPQADRREATARRYSRNSDYHDLRQSVPGQPNNQYMHPHNNLQDSFRDPSGDYRGPPADPRARRDWRGSQNSLHASREHLYNESMRRRRSEMGEWKGSQSSLRSGEALDHAYLNRRTTVHNMNQPLNSEYYPRNAEYANMDYNGYSSRDSLPHSGYNSRDSLPSGYRLVLVKDKDLATTPYKEVVGNPWYQHYSTEHSQTED